MIVQLKVDGKLAYDSRLPDEAGYTIGSIRVCDVQNKGGSATIVLPSQHPLRGDFRAFSSEVVIYRDGVLRWRGRPLPHVCDRYNRRTITCEGELCFLQDAVLRPCNISGSPASVFTEIINAYNARVEPWKRFDVGTVTVTTDAEAALEIKNAQSAYAAVQSLIKSYGGYIIFDSADDGTRRINWYAKLPYTCNQRIRWGVNLTDYSTSADTSDFATRIVPYGALDANGNRITINVGGKDYVENAKAVASRGIIEAPKVYSGIKDRKELQDAAQRDVDRAGVLPETIKLSAVDLSRQDASLDAFRIGQRVRADSAPHNMSGLYDLVSIDEDLMDASVGTITLTRDADYVDGTGSTLTGSIAYSVENKSAAEKTDESEKYAEGAAYNAALTTQVSASFDDYTLGPDAMWEKVKAFLLTEIRDMRSGTIRRYALRFDADAMADGAIVNLYRYQNTDNMPAATAIFMESDGKIGIMEGMDEGNDSWFLGDYLVVSGINPRMDIGTVYRTTERWMGRPVYTKLIDFGTLPSWSTKYVTHNLPVSHKNVVGLRVIASNDNETIELPAGNAGNFAGYAWCKSDTVAIRATADLSSYTAVVELKWIADD